MPRCQIFLVSRISVPIIIPSSQSIFRALLWKCMSRVHFPDHQNNYWRALAASTIIVHVYSAALSQSLLRHLKWSCLHYGATTKTAATEAGKGGPDKKQHWSIQMQQCSHGWLTWCLLKWLLILPLMSFIDHRWINIMGAAAIINCQFRYQEYKMPAPGSKRQGVLYRVGVTGMDANTKIFANLRNQGECRHG